MFTVELLVLKNSSYTLVQKHCFPVSVCHRNMSSTWGYAIPVTEEVLAMRGRGGGCTNAWWGFLSALFSYMYLSACGLQNSSPESPLGLVLSDIVITGQHTNVVVYKIENKEKSCFFFSFQRGSVIVHIFTGSEMIHEKWLTYQSNLALASKWKKKACWLVSNQRKNLWVFCLPLHTLCFWVHVFILSCDFFFF